MKSGQQSRLARERKTIEAMIGIYCRDQHATRGSLCPECEALAEYARLRLQKCPFQQDKTTCAKCPIHCYKPEMREKVRSVMRYAGPRMMYRHPVLAFLHLLDGLGAPAEPRRIRSQTGESRSAEADSS